LGSQRQLCGEKRSAASGITKRMMCTFSKWAHYPLPCCRPLCLSVPCRGCACPCLLYPACACLPCYHPPPPTPAVCLLCACHVPYGAPGPPHVRESDLASARHLLVAAAEKSAWRAPIGILILAVLS